MRWLLNFKNPEGRLLNFKNPEGQTARWLNFHGNYNFEIQFRPGAKHSNDDGLSRRRPCLETGCNHCKKREEIEFQSTIRTYKTEEILETNDKWIESIPVENIKTAQQKEEAILEAKKWNKDNVQVDKR